MAKVKTPEEQKALCEAWRQSRLSKTEFCLMNNISLSSFYSWLKKLNNKVNPINGGDKLESKVANDRDTIKFLKMPTPLSPNISVDPCYLEIALPNGVTFKVKVPPGNIDKFLAGLLTWK